MNTDERAFMDAIAAEEDRLKFLLSRDSAEDISTFVKRTHNTYCRAMKDIKNMAATREHMHKFFASCVVYEHHLLDLNPQTTVIQEIET